MDDAAKAVPALPASFQIPILVQIEGNPEGNQGGDVPRAFVHQNGDGFRVGYTRPRRQRILKWKRGLSSLSTAAAMLPWASQELEMPTPSFVKIPQDRPASRWRAA